MTDLERAAAHARAMTTATHTPACEQRLADWRHDYAMHRMFGGLDPGPKPVCDGCVSDTDREQWRRMADEAEAHLARKEGT